MLFSISLPMSTATHRDGKTNIRKMKTSAMTVSGVSAAIGVDVDGCMIQPTGRFVFWFHWIPYLCLQSCPALRSNPDYTRPASGRGQAEKTQARISSRGELCRLFVISMSVILSNRCLHIFFESMYVYTYMHAQTYFQNNILRQT